MPLPRLCLLLAASLLALPPAWAVNVTSALASAPAPRASAHRPATGRTGSTFPEARPAGPRAYQDCAPWDGLALTVELPREDGSTVRLCIWEDGMRLLEAGQADLTLTDDMGPRGHGTAALVLGEATRRARPEGPRYLPLRAHVVLERSQGGKGNVLHGRVTFQAQGRPQQTVPFSMRIEPQVTPCG
jgi:hypothetical protein